MSAKCEFPPPPFGHSQVQQTVNDYVGRGYFYVFMAEKAERFFLGNVHVCVPPYYPIPTHSITETFSFFF